MQNPKPCSSLTIRICILIRSPHDSSCTWKFKKSSVIHVHIQLKKVRENLSLVLFFYCVGSACVMSPPLEPMWPVLCWLVEISQVSSARPGIGSPLEAHAMWKRGWSNQAALWWEGGNGNVSRLLTSHWRVWLPNVSTWISVCSSELRLCSPGYPMLPSPDLSRGLQGEHMSCVLSAPIGNHLWKALQA